LSLHEHPKAALDPCVELLVEGVVLTSPAIHVPPSHPIIKVRTTFYASILSNCVKHHILIIYLKHQVVAPIFSACSKIELVLCIDEDLQFPVIQRL
jgi:hypothetical protein